MKASSNKGARAYLGNTAWLMAESLISNLINLLILVAVARWFGAESYGTYAYVFATAQLFAMLGQMGLDGLLTRDLVSQPDDHHRLLGTAGSLRFAGYFLGAIGCLAYGLLLPEHTATEKYLFVAGFFFILFTPAPLLLETWFRSRVEAQYSSAARIFGTLAGGVLKIAIISMGWSIVAIGFAQTATVVLTFCVLLPLFMKRGGPAMHRWSFDRAMARQMLNESWVVFLGALMAVIYLKVDLVMLRWWQGPEEVGIYSVASRMSEVFYLIPAALVTSMFPKLIQIHRDQSDRFGKEFGNLLALLALLGYAVVAAVILLGPLAIELTFGSHYEAAGPVLAVHVLALPFVFMRYAFSRWILVERFTMFSLVSQSAGALANVGLNLILIPTHGMMGAAIATLVSYAAASYFALLLSARTRPVFAQMTKALLMPWTALSAVRMMGPALGKK